ncbi:N/A [soil metagenome]
MTIAVVTGARGFIGAATAAALETVGTRVIRVGASSTPDPLTPEIFESLGSFDMIVHCAGGSSVAASVADPRADFAKTVEPFAALLEHVRTRSPSAGVVLLSSAAVYGDAKQQPTPETATLSPASPYGEHKQKCEELAAMYGAEHGVASVVLRLFSVYGAGLRKQLLWDACTKASRGETKFAGTGDEVRDWLHIDDAVRLIMAVAPLASTSAPIFNGGGGAARVRDVLARIYSNLAAGSPTFSGEVRAGDPKSYVADTGKARATGWRPTVGLDEGIARFVSWFRGQA